MERVLFICGRNRLRSPTAEQVFSAYPDLEVASAGLNHDSDNPLTVELVEWAEIIFVIERTHRIKLSNAFGRVLGRKRVICLEIPDKFEFMQPELISLLQAKVPKHFRRQSK